MILRSHQQQMQALAIRIREGEVIRAIDADVSPGGGKSGFPPILAKLLCGEVADKLVWVAPRNNLKYQGEAEFLDPRWETNRRLRATNGNESNPDRGLDGYLTTYQAIAQSPEAHQDYFRKYRSILFLDEPHHVIAGGAWDQTLQPLVDEALLVVRASGTFDRGDRQPVAGMRYVEGQVFLADEPERKVIRYSRAQALRDRSILPVHPRVIDGSASWIDKSGVEISSANLDDPNAVFTALRTEYALALLDTCLHDFELMRREQFPAALMLVVAPDIETSKAYRAHIARTHLAEIATSEDSLRAHNMIRSFRRGLFPVLVTVGMAYEGLSVPNITHIACLTHIRSRPWLEQCLARANRVSGDKPYGVVYGPSDKRFLDAMAMIEAEQRLALKDLPEAEEKEAGESSEGGRRITPLNSQAYVNKELQLFPAYQAPEITPSEAERVLRDNIRAIRKAVINKSRPGSSGTITRVFDLRVREGTGKPLEEQGQPELEATWLRMRERFGDKI